MKARTRILTIFTVATLGGFLLVPQPAQAAVRCFGQVPDIVGTQGNDRLRGTPRADVIVGLGGADHVRGRGGNDRICLGDGRDVGKGQRGNDWMSGGGLRDFLGGGAGNDTAKGDLGDDFLFGRAGDDRLLGGASSPFHESDFYVPGPGDDLIRGSEGCDPSLVFCDAISFFGANGVSVDLSMTGPQATGQGTDRILLIEEVGGSEGNDILTGNGVDNTMSGLAGNDVLRGLGGGDEMEGRQGHDDLSGGGSSDRLFGGAGNDVLSGADGFDDVVGGPGDDDLSGGINDDYLVGGPGTDPGDAGETGEVLGDFCWNLEPAVNCEHIEEPPASATSSRGPTPPPG